MNPAAARPADHHHNPDAPDSNAAPDGSAAPSVPPATMRAAIRRSYGDAEVVEVGDVPTPAVTARTVLVSVKAAAVNPLDWHTMTGTPWLVRSSAGLRQPKNPAMGVDFSGRVVAVGSEVSDFSPGDEVVGVNEGAFAQYVAASPNRLVHKPIGVSFQDAGGMGVGALTALQGLRDKAELEAGQRVLVNGASGGVGTAAVQLAKWLGAEVTAVCSTKNADLVRSLGADHVIDYTAEDFADGEARFDVLFDNQGNKSLRRCRRILNDDGTYLLVGGPKSNRAFGPMGRMARALAYFALVKPRAKAFIAATNRDDLATLAELMASGDLRVVIDTVYPLDETATAMRQLAGGHVAGKLVITP